MAERRALSAAEVAKGEAAAIRLHGDAETTRAVGGAGGSSGLTDALVARLLASGPR